MSGTSFFRGNADGIIDAANVDLEYDNDGEDDIVYSSNGANSVDGEREDSVSNNSATNDSGNAPSSWAKLVNPQRASTGPLVNYTLDTSEGKPEEKEQSQEVPTLEMGLKGGTHDPVEGQFDDASEDDDEEGEDAFSNSSDSDGELEAINIANAASDDELSDEECDTFILEPHEAAYYNKLREKKTMHNEDDGIESEFPSLAAAATVPYEGSDDEAGEEEEDIDSQLAWKKEEEERKKKSLQPMVNGRVINNNKQASYNSFRKYGNVVSTDGSAVAMKKQKEQSTINDNGAPPEPSESVGSDVEEDSNENAANQEYKSRILGAAGASANDFPSEMTADDDDGEGWVTSTRDIQTMKATGSLHIAPSRHSNKASAKAPRKDVGPPISQRAACATTDFAMQNVILQMNLELLSVDGVRVRRLKTWVTRCGACFTIYGHDDKKKGGGRLFCDKCGSNALQRIAASVDRNTGRLKLHMRKNYQYNTRGTKFSLPKAGKVSVLVC
jgi:RNA-binding protein NOB1